MNEFIGWGIFGFGVLLLIPMVVRIIKLAREGRKGE